MGASVRQKNGSWYVFVRHEGQRAAKKCRDEEHAIRTAEAITSRMLSGEYDLAAMKAKSVAAQEEKARAVTLEKYFEDTLCRLWERSLSRSTWKGYEGSFRVHILPELGSLPLAGIRRDRVKRFVVGLVAKDVVKKVRCDDGKERTVSVRPRSKESVRNVVAALRAAFSEAVDSELIVVNPAARLGKLYREVADYRDEVDPFQKDDVPLVLRSTLKHYGFQSYCILLTAFHSGLRAGEIAGLQWSDVDFRNQSITVRRQFSRGRYLKTKTRKKRVVDMSSELGAELRLLQKERKKKWLEKGKNEIPAPVFINEAGAPVDMNNFRNRVFLKACDRAQVRRRRLHDTRHTYASLLLASGESLKYIQTQLGHSSIRLTADTYGHLQPGENRKAVEKLPTISTEPEEAAATA